MFQQNKKISSIIGEEDNNIKSLINVNEEVCSAVQYDKFRQFNKFYKTIIQYIKKIIKI